MLNCTSCNVSTAIDYSDSSVLEARSTLDTISTFCHDAQAYMKGQLQCSHVQEDLLWSRCPLSPPPMAECPPHISVSPVPRTAVIS